MKPFPIAKDKKGEKYYFGYAILKNLIDSFQEENKKLRKCLIAFVFIFGIFRGLIPVLVHLYYRPSNPYLNAYEYFIAAISFFKIASMIIIVSLQASLGLFDLLRKVNRI